MSDDKSTSRLISIIWILALPFGIFLWGWATYEIWGWFAPVVSPLLPALSIPQCIALRLLLGVLRGQGVYPLEKTKTQAEKAEKATALFLGACLAPVIVVGFSWLIHLVIHASAVAEVVR